MGQSYGIPGRTQESKDFLVELFEHFTSNDCPKCDDDHGVICQHEVPLLGQGLDAHGELVDQQVDAIRISYRVMKVGITTNTKAELNDYSRVYNEPPLQLPIPETNEKRRCGADHNDAA